MTNDLELSPDLFDNEEENDIGENLTDLSLSSSPDLNEQIKSDEFPYELHDQIDEVLHINEDKEENDLIKFITKAREQGFNCLDLSKKNINEFPSTLLIFPSLQYLYLEGNQIAHLPDDLFLRLPNLKWIDLRNNQITQIPTNGLDKHTSLKYLLLSGNLIRRLPIQLGKVKGLSALNLDGNPLDHPPFEIVKQGIKAIQQYLRDEKIQSDVAEEENDDDDEEQRHNEFIADVWASSDEENDGQRRRSRSPHPSRILTRPPVINLPKSKSETDHYITSNTKLLNNNLQSCIHFKRVSYSEMRMRPPPSARQRAKSDLKLPRIKTKRVSNDPIGDAYAARAQEEQRLIQMKHRNMKINEELQKVKNKDILHDWKEDYRSTQQQLRRKRLIKGKDYQEAVVQAPFGIDPHYIPVMDKNQQEMLEKAIRYESRRNRSPESAAREEEERRIRDRQIQDRIREITGKMLKRRNGVRGNALEEKRLAELELRELKKLETEVKQRRAQIDNRFKAYTGDVKARKKL